jgi:hypothetical protein
LKESKYLQEIENLKKENTELKKEKISFIGKTNNLKNEISKIMVDSFITEIVEYKQPDNNVEKKEKINKITKKQYKFCCEKCNYYTDIKCDFDKHKKSNTHIQKENGEFEGKYQCKICNKTYNTNAGLWKHKKSCQLEKEDETKKEKEVISNLIKGIMLEIKE